MKKIERITELERKYVNEVLDNQFISSSSYIFVTRLEQKFAEVFGAKHAIAMTNGTATLHMALEAAGIGPGDEVICPPLTMSSTSLAVLHANAIPVFADVDKDTFLLDADAIRRCITPRTRAIIPVSLYGLMPDMDAIMSVADEYSLTVIEDNAQCFLTKKAVYINRHGHMASYSFQSSKHMTCGEGGIITTDDDGLALNLRRYSGLGYAGISAKKGRITRDDIQSPDYERHIALGYNYRMSDLCGAVALAQLERLNELIEMRVIAARHLLKAMESCEWLRPQAVNDTSAHNYWTVAVVLERADVTWMEFRKKFMELGGHGIYAAWMLSYREPAFINKAFLNRDRINEQFKDIDYTDVHCPIAEYLQPRLLQFKTNYWDESDAIKQADVIKRVINSFDDRLT